MCSFLCVQAFFPTPITKSALVGKAAAIVFSTLALAAHALWARPFVPAQAWKGPVRAALLVLAAASAAIVAWAGALDLRILSGPGASRTLTAGSYTLVVLCVTVMTLLIAGVSAAMFRGAKRAADTVPTRESVAIGGGLTNSPTDDERVTVSPPSAPDIVFQPEQKIDASLAQLPAQMNTATVSVAASDNPVCSNPTFNAVTVRRRQPSVKRRQREESRSRPEPHPTLTPAAASAAATLADAVASDVDVVVACDGVVALLRTMSAAEARAASAALLLSLSARLEAALSGGAALDSAMVEAVCRAMSALSDHADSKTMLRLAQAGLGVHIAALLRQCLSFSTERAPPVLDHALWLLGNVAADKSATTAFVAAGGAEVITSLLMSANADSLLHVCVGIASLASHPDAAVALLRAGATPALARCLPQGGLDATVDHAAADTIRSPGAASSIPCVGIADAEAACRALASILRHCAASAENAARASGDLACSGAIAGCTAALQRAAASPSDSLPMEYAARVAEVLLYMVGCATATAGGSAAASVLAREVAAAGTEVAVQRFSEVLAAAPVSSSAEEEAEAEGLRRSLASLAAALQRWLTAAGGTHGA